MERRKLCVIGDPVEHSKSPLVQNTMIGALGIPYEYGKVKVSRGETAAWLKKAKADGYAGFNATMPHKVDLIPLMDELGEDAKTFGAVNTVCIRPDGTTAGYNTDGRGFLRAIEDLGVFPEGLEVCLLGAGGAAKAVALKLAKSGAKRVAVCNRTQSHAEALCAEDETGVLFPAGFDIESLKREAGRCRLLVNCTSLGMTGTKGQFEDLNFLRELPEDSAVYDLIYSPAETELLKAARALGHRAANGLGMLVYQGIFALEHFAGVKIDAAEMKKRVEEVL